MQRNYKVLICKGVSHSLSIANVLTVCDMSSIDSLLIKICNVIKDNDMNLQSLLFFSILLDAEISNLKLLFVPQLLRFQFTGSAITTEVNCDNDIVIFLSELFKMNKYHLLILYEYSCIKQSLPQSLSQIIIDTFLRNQTT